MKKFCSVLLSAFLATAQLFAVGGTFGESDALTWDYDATTHTLTITGTGNIPRYKYPSIDGTEPWASYKSSIEQIVIGDGIIEIGRSAFDNLTKLTSVTLGGDIEVIGDEAFSGCANLASIKFRDPLKSIGKDAFAMCSSITEIDLPKSLTSIGEAAFINCGNLTITAKSPTPPTATNAFEESVVLKVYIEESCSDVATYAAHPDWQSFDMQGPEKYNISVVSSDTEHGIVDGGGEFYCGKLIPITATATDPGYEFERWQDDNTDNPRQVRVLSNETYTAYFKIKTFKVEFYDATGTDLIYQTEVEYNTDVQQAEIDAAGAAANVYIADKVNPCQQLDQWVGGSLTAVTADQKLLATYKSIPYTLSVTANDPSYGDVVDAMHNSILNVDQTYDCGSTQTIEAVSNTCYQFVKWVVNGTDEITDNPYTYTFTVDGDIAIQAQFEITQVEVKFMAGEFGDQLLGEAFKIDCGSDIPAEYVAAAETAAAELAPACQEFDKWDGETTGITTSTTLTALYKPIQYTLTVTADDDSKGEVSGSGDYDCGTKQNIQAFAKECYQFTQWDDGNTENPRSIDIDGNKNFTAQFESVSYTVTFLGGASGTEVLHTANVECNQNVSDEDLTAAVAAANDKAAACKMLDKWELADANSLSLPVDFTEADFNKSAVTPGADVNWSAKEGTGNGTYMFVPVTYKTHIGIQFGTWEGGFNYDAKNVVISFIGSPAQISFKATIEGIGTTFPVTNNSWKLEQYDGTAWTTVWESTKGNGETSYTENITKDLSANATKVRFTRGGNFAGYISDLKITQSDAGDPTKNITESRTLRAVYTDAEYTLTVTSADETMGKVTGSGTYACNEKVNITATAEECYKFVRWDDSDDTNPREVVMDADKKFEAQFELATYTVRFFDGVNSDPVHTVVVNCKEDVSDSDLAIAKNNAEASAPACGVFKQWDKPTTAVMADLDVIAQYDPIYYTITASVADECAGMGTVTGGGDYECGKPATLTATPAEEKYTFDHWSNNSTTNPLVFNVEADAEYTAYFKLKTHTVVFKYNDLVFYTMENVEHGYMLTVENAAEALAAFEQYMPDCNTFDYWEGIPTAVTEDKVIVLHLKKSEHTLTVKSENTDFGTVTGSGVYECGTEATLTATAKTGYEFDHWSDDATETTHPVIVTADAEYTAYFKVKTFNVEFTYLGATFYTIENVEYNSSLTTEQLDAALAAFAMPECSSFKQWNTVPANIVADTKIAIEIATAQFTVKATSENTDFGTVIGSGTYECGTTATLTATAKTGYEFDHWSDDATETTHPVTVTADAEYTAYFKVKSYDVTFVDWLDQLIAVVPVEHNATVEAPQAPEREGYTFVGWDKPLDHITADVTIKALYTINQYTVNFWSRGGKEEGYLLKTVTVDYGTTTTAPVAPLETGYTFVTWDPDFSIVKGDMDITALYTINQYTVTFLDWTADPQVIATSTVDYLTPAVPPADEFLPEHYGYHFDHWSKDISSVKEDFSVNAIYVLNHYTVEFIGPDGTAFNTQDVTHGSAAVEPAASEVPEKEGYHFNGAWDKTFDNVESDLQVHPNYDLNVYTVTFKDFDNTVLKTETVNWHEAATAPDDPIRGDHVFIGWDTDFSSVESDLTVRAMYVDQWYTVRFLDYNGKVIKSQTVEYLHAATAPVNPTRIGYTFTGWDPADFSSITADLDVTALYETNIYTVRFLDWNNVELSIQHIEHGKWAVAPDEPEREGYTFTGWDQSFNNVTSDLVIYAVYDVKYYKVTFRNWNDDVLKIDNVAYGKSATPPADPTRPDHVFIGWEGDYSNVTADITVVAKFAGMYYNVRFHDFDGRVLWTSITSYGEMAVAPENPTREGYTFTGWDKDYSSVTEDMDINALYNINSYTVEFRDFDGTSLSTQTVNYGQSATAPAAPAHEGLTFTGWDTDYTQITGNTIITAQYAELTFTVIFNDYNAVTLKVETVQYGNDAVPPTIEPRVGYKFEGWDGGDYHNITANTTLTARYSRLTFTVTFIDFDGALISSQTVNYGERPTEPTVPAHTGKMFDSWDKNFNYIVSDLVVQAVYKPVMFVVSFRDYDGQLLKNQDVEYGGSATAPAEPTRTNYTFLEWDTDFSYITKNTTVTARYRRNFLDVTFRDWNGEILMVQTVMYGASAIAPEVKGREGYHHTGWDKDFSAVYDDMDIKALYEINEYIVEVYSSDLMAGVVLGGGQFKHGETATVQALPDEEYLFTHWSNQLTDETITITVTSDTVLTAYFILKPFTIEDDVFYTVCPGDTIILPSGKLYEANTKENVLDTVWFEYVENVWCDSAFVCHITVYEQPTMPAVVTLPTAIYSRPVNLIAATASIDNSINTRLTSTTAEITDRWWEILNIDIDEDSVITETWLAYEDDTIMSYDTLAMRYGITTACGDTLFTERMLVPVLRPNADNCEDCYESTVAVVIYDWLLMLDKHNLNEKGYVFPADSVKWYKVVGTLDNLDDAPEVRDDEQVASGFYYSVDHTLAGTGDSFYAVIFLPEQKNNVPCLGLIRSNVLQFIATTEQAPRHITVHPTLVQPAETITVSGINPDENTVIKVYSPSGQLMQTITTTGREDISLKSEISVGLYMISVKSPNTDEQVKYIVKQ
ncbi:MAG: InlB B-repeat-containing protein [Paludibacteraceae bacterium]|nr:InlB B-repeat-containing protein [Paludibacteraceae bacterium]